jgi:hypothetical protein
VGVGVEDGGKVGVVVAEGVMVDVAVAGIAVAVAVSDGSIVAGALQPAAIDKVNQAPMTTSKREFMDSL